MTELLGGLEWAGSLFKVLAMALLVIHLVKGRSISPVLQRIGSAYVLVILGVWTVEGFYTGLLTIYGNVWPSLVTYTIISRGILYFLLLVWCVVYVAVFPREGPDTTELHRLD